MRTANPTRKLTNDADPLRHDAGHEASRAEAWPAAALTPQGQGLSGRGSRQQSGPSAAWADGMVRDSIPGSRENLKIRGPLRPRSLPVLLGRSDAARSGTDAGTRAPRRRGPGYASVRRKAQAPPYLIGADYIINNWPSAMRQVNFWIVPANIHTDRHDADRSVQQPETCVYNMCTNHVCPFRSKIFRKHSHSPVNHWIRPKGQRTPSSAIVFHTNDSQRERDTAGAPETGDENATQRGISAIRC